MMLLDSNIIIYSIKPEYSSLRVLIEQNNPYVSAISYVEVLGYHNLRQKDKQDFTEFFENAPMIPLTQTVLDKAVQLRQQKKMSIGDSIVASTALLRGLALVTANTKDFQWIPELKLLNPML